MARLSWALERIGVEAAWLTSRGSGIQVAVIDDAIDTRHPEFHGRVAPGWDVTTGENNTLPRGWQPHGTKCAGVACAGGREVTGVAPDAILMPIRLGDVDTLLGTPAEADAIRWAADHGADVICCAWGPPLPHSHAGVLPEFTLQAIDHAVSKGRQGKGCVVVWSAGNDDCDLALNGYASHPSVIAVGASNYHDERSSYSNWGDRLWCVFPSNDPWDPTGASTSHSTTTPVGSFEIGETYYTDSFGFTSAACAGVAGLCALILSANPELTSQAVNEVLQASCLKIDPAAAQYDACGHSPWYGYGRPDAARAVQLARLKPAIPSV